jgi:hypothetical protein
MNILCLMPDPAVAVLAPPEYAKDPGKKALHQISPSIT